MDWRTRSKNRLVLCAAVTALVTMWQLAPGVFSLTTLTSFIERAVADTGSIEPDGNGLTILGTPTSCGAGGSYDCLNDGVLIPTAPSTGSDYVRFVLDGFDYYLMQTLSDVSTVNQVQVRVYHVENSTTLGTAISLYDANETTQYGTLQILPTRSSSQWDTATFSGLSLTQTQLNNLRVRVDCDRVSSGKPQSCDIFALYADVTYDPLIEVTVGTTSTQQNVSVGATAAHIGGAFTITENVSSRNVTSITIEENGTVNAATELDNIKLFYDLDTSSPYNCASESYSGTESQFGTTDTDGFSGADGTATFTGSVGISTTQTMCVYVVLDVSAGAAVGDTIEVEINNPTIDVVSSGSPDTEPAMTIALGGSSVLEGPNRNQTHYHWRNNDGDETDGILGASSATGGIEDTPVNTGINDTARLRLEVSNEGNQTTPATQYRLEYAQKITTCVDATGWTDVGAVGGDWDMSDSLFLTEGVDTTNIAVTDGGVSNENTTFLTPNGGVRDTTSQTGSLTLTSTQYLEMEFSIAATSNAEIGNGYCFRVTNAGTPIETYSAYAEATIPADITVSAAGAQASTVDIPTTDKALGGVFILTDEIIGNETVTSITITASGTVDYQNDINNIELRYDFDTSSPYDCASESYNGSEAQFGGTDTDGFSVTGTSTFSDSLTITTTQTACVYVVYDVLNSATNNETFEVFIENANIDVVISGGAAAPNATVDIGGYTTFVNDAAIQVHYHWRNDNGNETGATSATGGNEDTLLEDLRQSVPKRLRIGIANEGSSSTPAYQYRLEYAFKISTCAAATGWTDVGATDDDFNMFNSTNITDGANTTNISVASGGVTDVGNTFLGSNGGLKDTSSQTSAITLPGMNFVDLEYSIVASTTAVEGGVYCFRVTNAGTIIDGYDVYPEVSIKPKTDYFIQRGVSTITGNTLTITAGTDYVTPAASTTAFIRITNTLNTGAGGGTVGNADDVTVSISNPWNITSSITFVRPTGATGNTRVAWEIIEYVGAPGGDNEIVVRQQQAATYVSGNTTVSTPTVSNVSNDNDVAVFITGSQNPDTATNYHLGNSTAAWNGASDTATFTRGASGNTARVSYAVVEFVGDNWKVQRAQHTYTAAGSTETESITAVNSLSRTFLHTQKRMASGLTGHANFGHNVWLSGIGQISFALQSSAGTPSGHTSVAWVIENTQTIGQSMNISRSNGTHSNGSSPTTLDVNIGKTLDDLDVASIFMNNFGNENGGGGGQNSFPEPLMAARIISATQYELYIADGDDSRTWRAEIVEWPTAARDITQNYYRFYVDNGALDPTDPWPAGIIDLGENTEVTTDDGPIMNGSTTRIRMTLNITSASMDVGIDSFKLQYGERTTTCGAIGENNWRDLGDPASTTALWRGFNGAPTDGVPVSTNPPAVGALNISISDVAGTYQESNPSALTPYEVQPGEDVEYDWVVQHNGANDKTTYCFRMTEANGTLFDGYNYYPAIRTVGFEPLLKTWRWYDDEINLTPSSPLATQNTAPVDIVNQNLLKLRLTVQEVSGAAGTDIKLALQYSEYADFSEDVETLTSTTTCAENSLWCFADGAGVDNLFINDAVISDADPCVSGVGEGCGTHNEGVGTTTATFDHAPFTTVEYEFTVKQAGARANAVYYFRLYDINADAVVGLGPTSTYPSLVVEGAQLFSTLSGVTSGTTMAGVTADVDTTPTAIGFGSLPFGSSYEAIQELVVNTNATEGYQMFVYTDGQLINTYSDTIPAVTSSNAAPAGWSTACTGLATGCFGYHTTDSVLANGSARFAPIDSYAPLSTSPEEISYSSIPINDTIYMIYRLQVALNQPLGDYQAGITYLTIPVF